MAEQVTIVTEATRPEALLADRERFWSSWTSFVFYAAAGIALLLVLMGIFLV